MGLFSLQLTFTHGLILGQISILFLLSLVFKYLFLDTTQESSSSSFRPRLEANTPQFSSKSDPLDPVSSPESIEWLNTAILHILDVYRSRLRDDLSGTKGDALMRQRVEDYANNVRPKEMLDHIQVHSVSLGFSAPRLSKARLVDAQDIADSHPTPPQIEFDLSYVDSVSLSFSTAYLFNYPSFGFARLPVSLTISLSHFSSAVVLTPPAVASPAPALTLTIPPTFTLELKTTSLLGSRAKLADVPKLHELIADQIRRQLIKRGTIKIPLPGLSTTAEVKQELDRGVLEAESRT